MTTLPPGTSPGEIVRLARGMWPDLARG
jgi:hypothetical protein